MNPDPTTTFWSDENLRAPHSQPDKARRVHDMFAAVAPTYDRVNHITSFYTDLRWRNKAVRQAFLVGGERVLDVCCGTGDLSAAFAHAMPQPSAVIGADFCHPMLELASEKFASRRGAPLGFVGADAQGLPFADGSFDVVSCAFGIRNVTDTELTLSEMFRVLSPGGRAVILEFSMPSNKVVRAVYQFYFTRILPRVGTMVSGDRSGAYRYLPASVLSYKSPSEMRKLLRNAGFSDVKSNSLSMGVAGIYVGKKRV